MSTTQSHDAPSKVRVIIVDDHPTVCEGLGHRISSQPDMAVCGQAADVELALQMIRDLAPDVVVVDIGLRNSDGLELIKAVKAQHMHIRTLVHSMYDEQVYADRCLHAGAMGYINKEANANEVIRAIREIHAGRVYLSPAMASQVLGRTVGSSELQTDPINSLTDRQLEVFRLIGEGLTVSQIGQRLHISPHTVETHRDNLKRKLSVGTVSELTRRAVLWAAERS